MEYVVGVDIGGTFTDCVVVGQDGNITVGKALSTPHDFSIGVFDAIRDAASKLGLSSEGELIRAIRLFFHACTVGENTAITRTGAKTGLVTTRGFSDSVLMMRGKTTDGLTEIEAFHISAVTKPQPFVPKTMIEEVSERVDFQGDVLVHLEEKEARRALDILRAKGVESVAIALLWSVTNDSHEKLLARILERDYPGIFFALSSEAAPFVGEYERTITTVLNAYIGPKILSYLKNLEQGLKARGLPREPLIMQAYGGVLGPDATRRNAVGTIESGPAAGVVGAQFLGELLGERNILATDMGGTTFKVGVIRDGVMERDYTPIFQRYRLLSPKIWVESIGAGGGSIAWLEAETGVLKVGPQGAGANPGPVCYGFGGMEPTVSDADLVLGYLNEDYFLGGRMKLDKAKAVAAIERRVAKPLGVSVVEAASGIHRIVNAHMSDLIRKSTVERGYDPRDFVLFAYGGAAPVHASRYAADLEIHQVLIPVTASVQGATGLIASNVVYEYGKTDHLVLPADVARVNANAAALVDKAYRDLRDAGFDTHQTRILRSVDIRYRYQVHEVNVPLPVGDAVLTDSDMEELASRFDVMYEQLYGPGSAYRPAGKEILAFRVTAVGMLPKPQIKRMSGANGATGLALKGERPVYFEEYKDFIPTRVYDFEQMEPGVQIAGPAVIETPVTTILINPRDRGLMDEFRNIRIWVGP